MFKAWIENSFTEPVRVTINLNKINGEEYDDFEKLYMPSNSEGYSAFYLSDEEITELNSIERNRLLHTFLFVNRTSRINVVTIPAQKIAESITFSAISDFSVSI